MSLDELSSAIEDLGGRDAVIKRFDEGNSFLSTYHLGTSLCPPEGSYTHRHLVTLAKDVSFQKAMVDGLKRNDFSTVRKFFSKKPPATQKKPPSRYMVDASLQQSFVSKYFGVAVDGLFEFLRECNRLFHKGDKRYYAKFCSIVQCSGVGKSRTMIELMKRDVIVLYLNIRGVKEDNCYPPRDVVPARILTENLDCSVQEYTDRCVAFFTAIFIVMKKELLKSLPSPSTANEVVQEWSKYMCKIGSKAREQFLKDLQTQYEESLRLIKSGRRANEEYDQDPHDSSPVNMTPSFSQEVYTAPELQGGKEMTDAYMSFISSFPTLFSGDSNDPKVVIAIDEAHPLAEPQVGYRPSHIICRVISVLSATRDPASIWVVFASTTFEVADFSAPALIYPSLRISQGGKSLFPPYSQLGWDQMAPDLNTVPPRDAGRSKNIVGYGRPLWFSLMEYSMSSLNSMLDTAGAKLCNAETFNPRNKAQAIAVLGQRLILDIAFGREDSFLFQQEAISSHLRVCLETTEDRTWQTTLYPSEPLLSCAAAQLWYNKKGSFNKLEDALETLQMEIANGLIDIDQKGELTSRIVYIVGKDLAVRHCGLPPSMKISHSVTWDEELLDCQPLRVVDYLKFVFGEEVLKGAEECFEGWYINFSHWIVMSESIDFGNDSSSVSRMDDWLRRHWTRTCAVQCCHDQRSFDKLIPMYKLGLVATSEVHAGHASYILISERARKYSTQSYLDTITPHNAKIPDMGQPYIVIHADLRIGNRSLDAKFVQNKHSTAALRIYAPGISSPYAFLRGPETPKLITTLEKILEEPKKTQNSLPTLALLDAQVLYGDAVDEDKIRWEAGRETRSKHQ